MNSFKEYMELSFDTAPTMAPEPAPLPPPEVVQAAETVHEPVGINLAGLIVHLFDARNMAHRMHLAASLYAEHQALGELYELLSTHADDIAEAGQGIMGFKLNLEPTVGECPVPSTSKQLVADLAVCIENARKDVVHHVLVNMLDDLLADVYKVKYKLDQLT